LPSPPPSPFPAAIHLTISNSNSPQPAYIVTEQLNCSSYNLKHPIRNQYPSHLLVKPKQTSPLPQSHSPTIHQLPKPSHRSKSAFTKAQPHHNQSHHFCTTTRSHYLTHSSNQYHILNHGKPHLQLPKPHIYINSSSPELHPPITAIQPVKKIEINERRKTHGEKEEIHPPIDLCRTSHVAVDPTLPCPVHSATVAVPPLPVLPANSQTPSSSREKPRRPPLVSTGLL
jgi:hypothetical protein